MRRAIVSCIVSTGDAPVSYWPIFSISLLTIAENFGKVTFVSYQASCGLERLSLTLLYCKRQYALMKEKHILQIIIMVTIAPEVTGYS